GRAFGTGVPASVGRPSARHRAKPPSTTATASWPKARKVHHTRAALTTPRESYTITRSRSPMPSPLMCRANAAAPGSMCGSVVRGAGDAAILDYGRQDGVEHDDWVCLDGEY